MIQTINNVTCAACGCVCENATAHVDGGQIVQVDGACSLCTSHLMGRNADDDENPNLQAAIDQAIEILNASRAPLIYGLRNSTVETQRAAVALADRLGASIDPSLPAFHRSAIMAMQSVGVSACTLGEVKQRADVIVIWGGDPATTHPRLYERFLDPPGRFVQARHVIGIGVRPTNNRCDEFLQIDIADTLATLSALRALVTGLEISETTVGRINTARLKPIASRLQQANYSAIFFGPEIGGEAELESLFLLVRQLNLSSRSAAIGLGGIQCDNVLTWQTGYPCGVNFSLGYPRYAPRDYSASVLLERGEVDAVLLVGSGGLDELSPAARSCLDKLPTILLDSTGAVTSSNPTVRISTALSGVHCEGTVFRMDGVPIRLRSILDSTLPTDSYVISAILEGVSSQCA